MRAQDDVVVGDGGEDVGNSVTFYHPAAGYRICGVFADPQNFRLLLWGEIRLSIYVGAAVVIQSRAATWREKFMKNMFKRFFKISENF